MYWNGNIKPCRSSPAISNLNMRCIEISDTSKGLTFDSDRTLTWDVLKSVRRLCKRGAYAYRTLTWDVLKCKKGNEYVACTLSNLNMRCIEILPTVYYTTKPIYRTLTWDVLKFLN